MAEISIIIPAYNSEKYLAQCLASASAQTMPDIEIIVVDDASHDATQSIIRQAAQRDARIRSIRHTENKSVMQARKTGFAHSTGRYILFMDSDDLLVPDACETAYQAICRQDTDLLAFGVTCVAQDGSVPKDLQSPVGQYTEALRTKSPFGLAGEKPIRAVSRSMWDKIYKREIVEKANENLPDGYFNMAEDWMFSYLAFYFSHSYAYVPEKLYRYRIGTGISTTAALSRGKIEAVAKMYSIYEYLLHWTQQHGAQQECAPLLEQMREAWLGDIAVNFLHSCAPQDREYFLERALAYCPKNTFFAALFHVVYERRAADPAELAEACVQLRPMKERKTQVKTVGTFYHRMRSGGIENVMCRLCGVWAQHGYRVAAFTGEAPQQTDYPLDAGVERIVIPTITEKSLAAFEARFALWEQYLAQYRVDIMVYHAWQDPVMMLPDAITFRMLGVPLVMHTHGLFCVNYINTNMTYAYQNARLSRYYRLADLVVALSETDEAWWKSCGLRCMRTMNPAGLTLSVPESPLCGKNILFVGRISPEKQMLDLLRIMELVHEKDPQAKLVIAGAADDEEYEAQVQSAAKQKHLEGCVEFAGYHKQMQPLYAQAAVQICTSRFEGQSLAISEGRICGLPLVTYELPNSDFIREGKGMFVVPQNDVQGAADAVVQLLSDEALRRCMGRQARQSAQQAFGQDMAAHWDAIFRAALAPVPAQPLLCTRPPLETAIALVNEYTAQGFRLRAGGVTEDEDAAYYRRQCNALNDTIEELRASASYRLGTALLSIPHRLKRLLCKKE